MPPLLINTGSFETNFPGRHPKYDNILDELRDIWRKNQRRLRKLRGLPATPEVGIIGDLIKQLRTATEARLGRPITSAVLATPRLPRITNEDLDDAMEYAGLTNLKSYRTWTYVSEPQATFAGMGFGLCEKWGDIEKCEDEEATFPVAHVLSVTFTHDVLSATYIIAQDARTVSFGSTTTRYDLGLGTWLQNPGSPTYWDEIREAIRRIAIISLPSIDYLLLSGEDATNEQFLETVKEALLPTALGNAPGIVRTSIDPLHVGAAGAAEFAKRWQGGTWNCMEPPRCAGNWQPGDDGWRGSWSKLREEL